MERFLSISLLTTFTATALQLLPLGWAWLIDKNLAHLIGASVVALALGFIATFVVSIHALGLGHRPRFKLSNARSLARYGSWIALSGIVGPILVSLDRVVIGALSGAVGVTRYTIPFNLVSRVQVIPLAFGRTLFPRFSLLGHAEATAVYHRALAGFTVVMTPTTIVGLVALHPFLRLWLGTDLATSTAPVGEILLMGMWVNSLAVVPFAYLQARGRPDLTAKFHLVELPPYCVALWLGLSTMGLSGAAWAWSARVTADAILLAIAAGRVGGAPVERIPWRSLAVGAALVATTYVGVREVMLTDIIRAELGLVILVIALVWAWRVARLRPYSVRL